MRSVFNDVPNVLSLSRIPLAAAFVATYSVQADHTFWLAIGIMGAALITDVLDGRIARAWKIPTVTGYLLDGLGDKVFYAAILLVITREDPTQILLAWSLIARELIWYGLRAVDPNRQANIYYLRSFSVVYAFVIRAYFLCFFVIGWSHVSGRLIPNLIEYYGALGIIAAVFGYIQIYGLSKMIIVNFYRS